ncbi:MAG: hypothetical protein ACI3WR_04970 [Oscillospiraceae bacterium]
MAYTVEQVQEILDRKKRKEAEQKQREAAQKQTAQANSTGGRTALAATTPQQTAEVRYQTGTGSAKAKQSAERPAVTKETRQESLEAYQSAKNSDQSEQDARADWLGAVNDDLNPALLVRGKTLYSVEDVQAVLDRKQAAQQAGTPTGLAGALAKSYEPYEQQDAFDRINAWYDEGDNRNLADAVRRVDGTNGAYTDADLMKAGWSRQQIDTARQMNAEYDAIPLAGRVLRRTTNAVGGVADAVAAAPILAAETGVQAVKNAAQRTSFESGLTEREKKLYDAIRRVDGTNGVYTDRDLVLNGYGAEEILQMRRRIAQLEADDALDTSTSVGYQLYSRGQRLTGAAQSGLTDTQKFLQSAATSAGENLLVAAVNPAAVLPVLSAQGAGEALGQSAEKGESAGKALLGGAAKFGAGWAINSVGAADLARTMGSDYAKDTLAGQIADAVRSLAGESAFARQYPAVANAITGGVDNAVQAFAETYADMAIDAALGDAEAAQSLFTKETLQSALVSAASGGLSGAAGGAVGTGIGQVRQNMQQAAGVQAADGGSWAEAARRWDAQAQTEKAAARTGETTEEQAAPEDGQKAMPRTSENRESLLETAKDRQGENRGEMLQDAPEGVQPDERGQEGRENIFETVPEEKALEASGESAESVDGRAESVGESAESVDGMAESVDGRAESVDGRAEGVGESAESVDGRAESVEESAGKPAEYRADLGQMDTESMTDEQRSMAETIASELRMSTGAAEAAVLSKPEGVGKDIYLMGANGVYRMAASGGAKSLAEAVRYSGAAAAQVAAVEGGTEALQRMYDWGKMDYGRANSSPYSTPGLAGEKAGTVEKSRDSRRSPDSPEGAVVQLSALAHDNEVVLKKTLAKNANACIETALGKVYLADKADAVTALIHEQMHDANAWDPEGGKLLADTAIRYLAQSQGMESVNGMIREKVRTYEEAGQSLTWEQAAEELVNDGMAGIFATKESFTQWARHEAELAKRTAKAKGTWEAVKQTVNDLLTRVIAAADQLLTREPNSKEARAMKALAEDQKEVLRQLSYEHSERAADAKAAAAANKNAEAGKQTAGESKGIEAEIRYQLENGAEEADEAGRVTAWDMAAAAQDMAALREYFDLGGRSRGQVTEQSLDTLTKRYLRMTASKADSSTVKERLRAAFDSMGQMENPDFNAMRVVLEDIAEELMNASERRDDSLWKENPDWHNFSAYVEKGSTEYNDLCYAYGSWGAATKELRRHGVTLTSAKSDRGGVRPALDQMYKELSGSAPGEFDPTLTGAIAITDRLAEVHDSIKHSYRNDYAENWEEARAEIAAQIFADWFKLPKKSGAQQIADAHAKQLRAVHDAANEAILEERTRADEAVKAVMSAENVNMAALEAREAELTRRFEAEIESIRQEAKRRTLENQEQIRLEYDRRLRAQRARYDERLEYQQSVYRGQLKRARDAREADVMRRNIRAARSTLDKWLTHPTEKNHVPKPLLQTAIQAADLANTYITMNDERRDKLRGMLAQLSQQVEGVTEDKSLTAGSDWEQAGLRGRIDDLYRDLETKDLFAAKGNGQDGKLRGLARLDNYQLACLQDILNITIQGIRNENRTVSGRYTEKISDMAGKAAAEVNAAKGNDGNGIFEGLRKAANLYQTNMLDTRRMLRRMGGYRTGGAMEQLADILEAGQTQKLRIEQEGEAIFADVTGAENEKQAKRFAGRNARRADLGFKDQAGNPVPLNHAQMCSLYMHLQNQSSKNHLLNGGFVVPDAARYDRGDIKGAYQHSRTVVFSKMPVPEAYNGKTDLYVLEKLKEALDDYDKKWIADMQKFYGEYTTTKLNEASLEMFGFEVAKVQNYYPISVDQTQLINDIEGLKKDGTILGRGFTKERVESKLPILLEECQNVVNRSLRDTADYAGMAPAIRDANRILNSRVENSEGVTGTLKEKVIGEKWGGQAVKFLDELLTDLQTKRKGDDNDLVKLLAGPLRSGYAGAVLTLNPSVALSQAASLPTAAAVLGGGATMKAAGQFVKNISPTELAKIEAEIDRYSPLMRQRLKGSGKAELSGIGQNRSMVQALGEKVPKGLTNWITKMDEITVASLWEGAKAYTESHRETLGLAQGDVTSGDYWNAVADVFNRTVEQTQPNYTVLQRNALQRSTGEMTKGFVMFTTQRFQNYGILMDAVGDYRAQAARYRENPSAENKAEVKRAGAQLGRAAASQAVQTAVFCLMKIGADFLLHKWEREQDENGDVTAKSVGKRFAYLYAQSALGIFYGGSELFSLCENLVNGTDYEVISPGGLSVISDVLSQGGAFVGELIKDTGDMDPKALEKHHRALLGKGIRMSTTLLQGLGVPAGNLRTNIQALYGWGETIYEAAAGEGFTLSGAPKSAASQYDRLYAAVQAGDAQEAKAALDKLDLLEQEGSLTDARKKAMTGLKTRLKEADEDLAAAVQARLDGDDERRQEAQAALLDKLYEAFGIDRRRGADSERKAELIDLVQAATNEQVNKALAGEGGKATDRLAAAVLEWDADTAQKEIDTLMRAGKSAASVKSAITTAAKPEYLAGTKDDKETLRNMLLKLTDAEGGPLYTAKEIRNWKEDTEAPADEWESWR